jgi:hypothetical protein
MSNLAVNLGRDRASEEARNLHETVLAARRRILGNRHPFTLLSIWNLYSCLNLRDPIAGDLLRELSWLVERDPAELSAQLGKIRKQVQELLQSEPTAKKHGRG